MAGYFIRLYLVESGDALVITNQVVLLVLETNCKTSWRWCMLSHNVFVHICYYVQHTSLQKVMFSIGGTLNLETRGGDAPDEVRAQARDGRQPRRRLRLPRLIGRRVPVRIHCALHRSHRV